MSLVVGYGPRNNDRSAIELACQLSRSLALDVHVVSVVPQGWGTPAAAGTDREFEQWAASEGELSAAEASADLAQHPGITGDAKWISGRSVPHALLHRARELEATALVVGSSRDAEPGRIGLGSKSDRLVHSSPIPVAIAPALYRTDQPVTRVTVAFRDHEAGRALLPYAVDLTRRAKVALRIVTFIVTPPRRPVTARINHPEAPIINQWKAQATEAQSQAVAYLAQHGLDPASIETTLAEGVDWARAVRSVSWEDGDVFVVGSSQTNPIARVFLGSSATKIIRYAPVPVIAVPGKE